MMPHLTRMKDNPESGVLRSLPVTAEHTGPSAPRLHKGIFPVASITSAVEIEIAGRQTRSFISW